MRGGTLSRQAIMIAAVAALGAASAAAAAPATASAAPAASAQPSAAPSWRQSQSDTATGTGQPAPAASGPIAATGLIGAPRAPRLPADQQRACPVPSRPGQMECTAVLRATAGSIAAADPGAAVASVAVASAAAHGAPVGSAVVPGAAVPGYGPSSLLSAYHLASASARAGRGKTIAIVSAFRDPDAAANLASYRRHYGLPSCTKARHCLRIVNGHGKAGPLPAPNADWALVEAQGLDMVSAICPKCHILLVEAQSNSISDLGAAENTAVAMGAKFISNGWSGGEFVRERSDDHYFNHPGVAITFAAGNGGYGPTYPADSPYVTAIGGTSLRRSHTRRGWTESVWADTGSGCSTFEAKPSWQRVHATAPNGCLNRAGNDVAAVANPSTGVAIYDTYRQGGWLETGGTSVAATIIAAAYALAGTPAASTYPASYPYRNPTRFHQVPRGSNGTCDSSRPYLCHGKRGDSGPAGLGTPNGTAGLANGRARPVTLVDPGTKDVRAGAAFSLRIKVLDTNRRTSSLTYGKTGLPAGLAIKPVPHSTDVMITGTLPSAAHTSAVTITAKDGSTGQSGSTRFSIVAVDSLTPSAPASSQVVLGGADCLDGTGGGSGDSVVVDTRCPTGSQFLQWAYIPGGAPGGPGELSLVGSAGLCLASDGLLAACAPGAADQTWAYQDFGQLENPATGRCLGGTDPGGGPPAQVSLLTCGRGTDVTWTFISEQVKSAIGSLCLAFRSGPLPAALEVATCGGTTRQTFQFEPNGIIRAGLGCVTGASTRRDGTRPVVSACGGGPPSAGNWLDGPGGELINQRTGLCLDDPGNRTASGTQILLEDCYGQPGEIWAIG